MKKIVANFKMNLGKEEIKEYLNILKKETITDNIIFCPSNIYLDSFVASKYVTGSQNVCANKEGAYTGEISANQLSSLGIEYCIVGHSERRNKFAETNEMISEKIDLLKFNNITPILCVGEKVGEDYKEVVSKQLDIALANVKDANIYIAYEPIWSIGTGEVATISIIEEVSKFIKEYIFEKFEYDLGILYGGSVNIDNAEAILNIETVEGLLIGGAALNPKTMINIMKLKK